MTKKRSEARASLVSKGNFFERHNTVLRYLITVSIGSLFLFGVWKVSVLNTVQKDVPNNYVCQIVGADQDVGILAMKCMVK